MPQEEYIFGLTKEQVEAIKKAVSVAAVITQSQAEFESYNKLAELFTL